MPTSLPILTKDGSCTLLHRQLQQTYHSVNGAVTESLHVFIDAGLRYMANYHNTINLLEVGLGTGLNALLAYKFAVKNNIMVHYTAIEPFPVEENTIKQLAKEIPFLEEDVKNIFLQIHNSPSGEKIDLNKHFVFQKQHISLQEFLCAQQFHLVFYDAFSPAKQPEMWADTVFQKVYDMMYPEGALVTYCAKGAVKRTLAQTGFLVESLPGPTGKREMIRAIKKQHQ